MPHMSKKMKQEWMFFINKNGRIQYNGQCMRCQRSCKQSFRVKVVRCERYAEM